MCHGIPPGQLVLRDEIADALLGESEGGNEDSTSGTTRLATTIRGDHDGETPSYLSDDEPDHATAITGEAAGDGPFDRDGSTPR